MFDDFNEALENVRSNVEEVLETTLREDFGIDPYVEGTKILSDELKEFMKTHKVVPQYDYRKEVRVTNTLNTKCTLLSEFWNTLQTTLCALAVASS